MSVDSIRVINADCLEAMPQLAAEGVRVDAVITDPPYHLTSIVKRFGSATAAPAKGESSSMGGAYARASKGFMGKQWDGGDVAFRVETWKRVFALTKPGAHLVAFSGTRTYHRMACAIEDAGFEIRDQLAWCYGSGFPKSLDVAKQIDKTRGGVRAKIRVPVDFVRNPKSFNGGHGVEGGDRPWMERAREAGFHESDVGNAITDEAKAWDGWGTALKPAWEPICLARKPISEDSVAANVLKHGTGALNIDGCRIESHLRDLNERVDGRWPANIVHDGSSEVLAVFPDAPGQQYAVGPQYGNRREIFGEYGPRANFHQRDDAGSAARFFYTAKADADDRFGSKHPTVKPVDLIAWLVRLVTPQGGLVLDPFAGSGTCGAAALREGGRAILIEREAEYFADINTRLAHLRGEGQHSAAAKMRHRDVTADALPLFGGKDAAE